MPQVAVEDCPRRIGGAQSPPGMSIPSKATMTIVAVLLGGGTVDGSMAGAAAGAELPDVIVIGEEHGNPRYRRILTESLPALAEAGFLTFAAEKPSNLQDAVERYVRASIALDDKAAADAVREISVEAARGRASGVRRGDTGEGVNSWTGRLEGALRPLVDAKLAGFDISLVDMDSSVISGYLRGGRDSQDAVNALHSTLEARNKHMGEAVSPRTVLLVGRAHTGSDQSSVEHFIRRRGLTAVSLDLKGADNGSHPRQSEEADFSATPDEVAAEGGILPYLRNRIPLPRASRVGTGSPPAAPADEGRHGEGGGVGLE